MYIPKKWAHKDSNQRGPGEHCPYRDGEPKRHLPNHRLLLVLRRHYSLLPAGEETSDSGRFLTAVGFITPNSHAS